MKSLWGHLGLLALGCALALFTWLKEEEGEALKAFEVEIWGGKPENVQSVTYQSESRKLRLEPKKDSTGTWYVVRFEKTEEPSAPHPHEDEGVSKMPPKPKRVTESFVAVKEAEELIKKLAPMRALRSVGKADSKSKDFGLDKPEGTLKVTVAGREQVLTIGGQTPGGAERYAKYGPSGEVFAIPDELTQSLTFADTRLMERSLHGFSMEDVERVQLIRAGKTREVVRVAGKQGAWADASTPTQPDETVVNWLNKLERIHVTEYVEKPEPALRPEDRAIEIHYQAGSKKLGFFELYKVNGKNGPEFLARTEYGRWAVRVPSSLAEQLDRDAGALFK